MGLVRAIVAGDAAAVSRLLAAAPALARACVEEGATRATAKAHYLEAIAHYLYAGDTALHVAAAPTSRRAIAAAPRPCTTRPTACRARPGGTRARRPRPSLA
jgi:hypothetical protein